MTTSLLCDNSRILRDLNPCLLLKSKCNFSALSLLLDSVSKIIIHARTIQLRNQQIKRRITSILKTHNCFKFIYSLYYNKISFATFLLKFVLKVESHLRLLICFIQYIYHTTIKCHLQPFFTFYWILFWHQFHWMNSYFVESFNWCALRESNPLLDVSIQPH